MKQKQVTESWKEFRLGEITECLDNQRIPITYSDRKKGDIPYYGANGQQDSIDKFIFNEELLLLAEDGGRWGYRQKCSYIIHGKSWVNNHAHVLRVNNDLSNIKFLMQWFNLTDLNKYISGTTRGKLTKGLMKQIKIPLPIHPDGTPDLSRQKQIADILEKAERQKERNKRLLELMDEYLKSVFYEMFLKEKGKWGEWEEGPLSLFVEDFIVPQRDKPKIFEGDIPWCRIEDFNGIYLSNSKSNRFVSKETVRKMNLKVYPINTVIVSCSAYLGKCAITKKPLVTNQTFIGLVPSNKLNSLFLYYYMIFKAEILNSMASGATIKYLSKKNFQALKVIIPPLSLQEKFAKIVEHVEKLKEKLNHDKRAAEELFNSLMQRAFKGELV